MASSNVWAESERFESADVDEQGGAEVIEVVLSWGDARARQVLAVEQVKAGSGLSIGESGDVIVPASALGADSFEIVRHEGERAIAIVPPGAKLRVDGWPRDERETEIACGHVVEILVGTFVARLARVREARRPAAAPLLRGSGAGFILGSALMHAAAFATVALFCPSLGATEEDPYDADRLALMQRMLNATAAPEVERQPDEGQGTGRGDVNAGSPARGAEGAAGKPDTDTQGRWAARGDAKPENSTLARERELAASATWGIIGMLPVGQSDPNAPVVPWGTVQNGSDDRNAIGRLYGGEIGDAMGVGGLGMFGLEEGGGGRFNAIGLNGFGDLGHTGRCIGNGPCDGIGVGRGRPNGGHESHMKTLRYGTPQTNGRLPPEVIQRIVRQNDGRYRFCYQNALKSNPTLAGRVTVKFVIARDGSVALAADGGSDIPDEGVRQCVVRAFSSLSFPQPESGTVTVIYPIAFNPE